MFGEGADNVQDLSVQHHPGILSVKLSLLSLPPLLFGCAPERCRRSERDEGIARADSLELPQGPRNIDCRGTECAFTRIADKVGGGHYPDMWRNWHPMGYPNCSCAGTPAEEHLADSILVRASIYGRQCAHGLAPRLENSRGKTTRGSWRKEVGSDPCIMVQETKIMGHLRCLLLGRRVLSRYDPPRGRFEGVLG